MQFSKISIAVLVACFSLSASAAQYVFKSPVAGAVVPVKIGDFNRSNPAATYQAADLYINESVVNLGTVNMGESLTKIASIINSSEFDINSISATISEYNGNNDVQVRIACTPPTSLNSAAAAEVCDLGVQLTGYEVATNESVTIKVKGFKSSSEYVEGLFTFTFNVADGESVPPTDPTPTDPSPPSVSSWCSTPQFKFSGFDYGKEGQTLEFPAHVMGEANPGFVIDASLTNYYPVTRQSGTVSSFSIALDQLPGVNPINRGINPLSSPTSQSLYGCDNMTVSADQTCTSKFSFSMGTAGDYTGKVSMTVITKDDSNTAPNYNVTCQLPFKTKVLPQNGFDYNLIWSRFTNSDANYDVIAQDFSRIKTSLLSAGQIGQLTEMLVTPPMATAFGPNALTVVTPMTVNYSGSLAHFSNLEVGTYQYTSNHKSNYVLCGTASASTPAVTCNVPAGRLLSIKYRPTPTANGPHRLKIGLSTASNFRDPGEMYADIDTWVPDVRWYPLPPNQTTQKIFEFDAGLNRSAIHRYTIEDSSKVKFVLSGDTSKFKIQAAGNSSRSFGSENLLSPAAQGYSAYATSCTNSDKLPSGTEGLEATCAATTNPSVQIVFRPGNETGTFIAGLQAIPLDGDNRAAPEPLMLIGEGIFDPKAAWSQYTTSSTLPSTGFANTKINTGNLKTFFIRNEGTFGAMNFGFTASGDVADFNVTTLMKTNNTTASIRNSCGSWGGTQYIYGQTCTTDLREDGVAPHIFMGLEFKPKTAGAKSITFTPITSNGTVLPGAITFTGSGTP